MPPDIEDILKVFADEGDVVMQPRVVVREYDFVMIGVTVKVTIYNYLAQACHGVDSLGYELSHHIKTPVQAGVYTPGTHLYRSEQAALRAAIECLTSYYRDALAVGHRPCGEWLNESCYFK